MNSMKFEEKTGDLCQKPEKLKDNFLLNVLRGDKVITYWQ